MAEPARDDVMPMRAARLLDRRPHCVALPRRGLRDRPDAAVVRYSGTGPSTFTATGPDPMNTSTKSCGSPSDGLMSRWTVCAGT